ncbi:hypothetical protein GEMRC1_012464 [Eukaryota sp. GEM-RC1]
MTSSQNPSRRDFKSRHVMKSHDSSRRLPTLIEIIFKNSEDLSLFEIEVQPIISSIKFDSFSLRQSITLSQPSLSVEENEPTLSKRTSPSVTEPTWKKTCFESSFLSTDDADVYQRVLAYLLSTKNDEGNLYSIISSSFYIRRRFK